MRKFNLLFLSLSIVFFSNTITAQVLGNEGYSRSNRYTQNALYNKDADQSIFLANDGRSKIIKLNDEFAELEINALYNAKADSYLAILSIIQNGASAIAADSMINLRYNGFCRDLDKYGIKKKDIFIDMISMVPLYSMQVEKKLFSKTYNEVPAGFKLQKNIHIYYKKGDELDRILTVASKHEIYDLIKVEYFVENTEEIYDSLFDVSIQALNKKVNKLKKLGIVLDTLKHIFSDQKSVLFPVDRYKTYESYGGISLPTGKISSAKTSQKTPTMFYNKVPYHKYDIVINPAFREPAVQYSYNIIVRYYLKAEKKEIDQTKTIDKVKNIYHIITPKGDVKRLNTN